MRIKLIGKELLNVFITEPFIEKQDKTVSFKDSVKKFKRSHQRWSIKKVVLKNFIIFTGKPLCRSHFLIKFLAYMSVTLLKKTPTQVFPVNIAKYLRTTFLENTSGRLLLKVESETFPGDD